MHPLMLYIDLQVPEPGEAELSGSAWYIVFVNIYTDPQTSEWYSYFKNDVSVHKMM